MKNFSVPRTASLAAAVFALTSIGPVVFDDAAQAQEWTAKAAMPGPGRHHPVNFVLDGKGYVVTGSTSSANATDDFYEYDPVTDAWTVLPDFPGPDRGYSYGGTYNGKGYLGFGLGSSYLRDLWEYDPNTQTWTELASCPGTARVHPAFVITDDGKIYVGMGNSSANYRDWWVYDIDTDAWTALAFLPGPARHHPFYFNIGDIPYVGFGHGASIYRDFYRYNPGDDTWTRMTDFPEQGRVAGQQFSHQGYGYVLSGDNQQHGFFPSGEFWRWDPSDDSWSELTHHPGSSRWAPGSFVIDNVVYMMGGLSNVQLETSMWSFPLLDPADADTPTLNLNPSFTVFPNPVLGRSLQVYDPNQDFGNGPILLLSASGREVARIDGTAQDIQLPSELTAGQYFLSIPTKDGQMETRSITVLR